ncbi:hypothetical protein X808_10480 [Mannheimia varigena USDA-ARS-USMARC-1296]|uniref:Uncharacterized protein n=1 Tax=Mannheimia varigena USDA-ARS-USMARC-1296 TaxID=1433287 RepID=W0QAJ5_9PAST|nr:hypothetical protein X808_10480 [Mannheimia varigena USDA-ARS-USMARC-1296]
MTATSGLILQEICKKLCKFYRLSGDFSNDVFLIFPSLQYAQ